MASSHICDICDDDGATVHVADYPYWYHLACVKYRIANPNNSRELRGMQNLLDEYERQSKG